MKQGWEIKKLGEICHTSNGLWKGKKPPFITIGVLRSTNFTKDCRLKLDDVAYIEVEEKSFAKRQLQRNDIVVERSGGGPNQPVGRVLLFDIDDGNFSFCNFTSALRVIDSAYISPIYLHKYLSYFYLSGRTVKMQSNTIGLRNLDYTKYLDVDVPIPSLAEQKRIVEILNREFERIDALKANAEQNMQHAKDLFQSALKQELQPKEGWVTVKLSDICTITSSKRIYKNEYVSDGIPFYRTKEIKEIANGLPISLELYISENRYTEIKKKYGVPQVNDMLVSAVGTIGEIIIVEDDTPFYFKDGNLVWLKGITNVIPLYLKYYLKSVIDNIKELTRGAAYNALTIEKFQEMEISFPIKTEQLQIVARLDKLNENCKALEENYAKTMALCDDMKQALLRKAFNGEL